MTTVSFGVRSRVTLKDVAQDSGFSPITVSRVVRKLGNVHPETIQRIQRSIDRLGYRPDPALSALAAYRSKQSLATKSHGIAFINCDGTSFTEEIAQTASVEADLLGYTMESYCRPTSLAGVKQLNRLLFHRGIRGVLLGPSNQSLSFEDWNWSSFSAVSLGAVHHTPAFSAVAIDYFQAAYSGAAALWNHGANRIALLVDQALNLRTAHRWIGGYAAWCMEHDRSVLVYTNPNRSQRFSAWWQKHRPDGVLTIHRSFTLPCSEKVCVGYLNNLLAQEGDLCFHSNYAQIGLEAVRMLHHAILRGETGGPTNPKLLSLQGHWYRLGHPSSSNSDRKGSEDSLPI